MTVLRRPHSRDTRPRLTMPGLVHRLIASRSDVAPRLRCGRIPAVLRGVQLPLVRGPQLPGCRRKIASSSCCIITTALHEPQPCANQAPRRRAGLRREVMRRSSRYGWHPAFEQQGTTSHTSLSPRPGILNFGPLIAIPAVPQRGSATGRSIAAARSEGRGWICAQRSMNASASIGSNVRPV